MMGNETMAYDNGWTGWDTNNEANAGARGGLLEVRRSRLDFSSKKMRIPRFMA